MKLPSGPSEDIRHYCIGLISLCDRPIATASVVAVVYALFLSVRLNAVDPGGFVKAGDAFATQELARSNVEILVNSFGYDGQFYYRLALDPFSSNRTDFGMTIDTPAYRQQRILYPALSRILSLTTAQSMPTSLIAVNWIAIVLLAFLCGLYAHYAHRHALFGCLAALYPGFFISLSLDLCEIVAACAVVGGILALKRERLYISSLLLSLGVLAKETTVLVPTAIAIASIFSGDRHYKNRQRSLAGFLPLLVFSIWQALLYLRWQQVPIIAGGDNVGLPIAGLATFVMTTVSNLTVEHARWIAEIVFITVLAAMALRRLAPSNWSFLALSLYAILALSLTRAVWVADTAFLRALFELYVLSTLIVIEGGGPRCWKAFCVAAPVWLHRVYESLWL